MAASEKELREARRWVASWLVCALVLLGVGIRYAPWTPPPARVQPPPPTPRPPEPPEEPADTPANPSLPLWPFFMPKNSR